LAKAVGWAAEFDDLAVMRETVDQRTAEQGISTKVGEAQFD